MGSEKNEDKARIFPSRCKLCSWFSSWMWKTWWDVLFVLDALISLFGDFVTAHAPLPAAWRSSCSPLAAENMYSRLLLAFDLHNVSAVLLSYKLNFAHCSPSTSRVSTKRRLLCNPQSQEPRTYWKKNISGVFFNKRWFLYYQTDIEEEVECVYK